MYFLNKEKQKEKMVIKKKIRNLSMKGKTNIKGCFKGNGEGKTYKKFPFSIF